MSTKVLKYISVCLLVLAFGAFGTGVAKAALTANANALTSNGVLTITGADVSVWSVASVATGDNLTVGVTGAFDASLILSSTGTGAAALQITTTAGGLDISVTGDLAGEDLDITTVGDATELRITSASNQADAILLNASNAAGGIDINFGTGNLDIDGTGVSADITIDGDLFSIDGTGTSNITVTAAVDEDFTVSLAGTADASLILSSTGTGVDALQITTTAGGLDISVTGTANLEDLDITTIGDTTEIRVSSASLEDDAITISATAATGGVYILAGNGEPAAVGTDDSIELRATVDTIVALAAAGSLVVDGSTVVSTNADGALDINVNSLTAGVEAVNVALTLDNTAALDAEVTGLLITLTTNDIDGDMTGISIVAAATTVATVDGYEAAIKIDNAENTAGSMPNAIIITSSGIDAGITTALNVSATEITNAISVGANEILGTTATIAFTDFTVSADGALSLLPDGNVAAFTINSEATSASLISGTFENTSGTLINILSDTVTQAGDLTGLSLDLSTLVTAAGDQDVTGINVQTPALTPADSAANTTTYTAYNISAAGALDTGAGGANVNTVNWRGVNVTIPVIDTEAGDTVAVTGLLITEGAITNGAGTETSIAIDVTDADIVTALSIGANDIAGTTGTITFTDFTVGADGNVAILPDTAGDALTITLAAGDLQAIVIDAATADSTNATGLIQLTMDTVTASANALSIDFQVNDAADANTYIANETLVTVDIDALQIATVYGNYVGLTVNHATGVTYGMAVEQAAAAEVVTAGILVDNLDGDDAMTNGILLRAAGGAMTTALNALDPEIVTALSVGANAIEATELDFNIAPDLGASSIAITASADAEDFLIDLIGAFNTSLTLRSAGNSTDALVLSTTAGGMDITVAGNLDTEDLDITATGVTTEIRVVTASTTADAFRLNASAGGIDIDAANSTLTISNTANSDGDDLTIEVLGAQTGTLALASAGTGADALTITTTAGGIDIVNGGAAGGEDIDMSSTLASVNITAGESAIDSIVISSTIGGIDITAAGAAAGEDIDITATGSSVNITATENAAEAIYIRANGGTSETIRIHADQGTGYASILIASDVGGVRIGAGIGVTVGGAASTDATASNVTYTAANLCKALMNRDPNGLARTDTTDTAANLVLACVPTIGDTHTMLLQNTADAAEAITIAAGVGVELLEPDDASDFNVVIEQNDWAYIRFTNVDGTVVVMTVMEASDAD